MMLSITGEISFYCIAFHICFVVFFYVRYMEEMRYLFSLKNSI